MYFTKGKQRAFELLMQQKPGFDRYQSGCAGDDEDCGTCRFYRPGWKYEDAEYPKELPLLPFFSVQGYFHFLRFRLSVFFFR